MTNPYPQPAYQPEPHQPAPPKAKTPKTWLWILGVVVAVGVGAAVGSAGDSTPKNTAVSANSAVGTRTVTFTATAPGSTVTATAPGSTVTAVAPAPQPVEAPATSVAEGPKTSFGDGTYKVGEDIVAGAYKSSGPRSSGTGHCYWARLKDDSGSNIIANDLTEGATRLTAKKGEYLQITGCDFTKG